MEVQSVAEKLLFTTVRIDTVNGAGQPGSGTGFIFVHKIGKQHVPVIVTNKHVIQGFPRGSITFTIKENGKPKLGHGFRLEIAGDFSRAWFGHSDPDIDVAVIPLAPLEEHLRQCGVEVFYQFVSTDIVPSKKQVEELDTYEELVFIGYPNGIWDKKNLLPVMRTGTTATPLCVDFEGGPKFLMDASVFPGSSGSPVFLYNPGMYYSKTGNTTVGSRIMFVGVVAAVFFRNDVNDIVTIPIPTQNQKAVALSREMIDLGIVYKSHTIVETIEQLAKSKGMGIYTPRGLYAVKEAYFPVQLVVLDELEDPETSYMFAAFLTRQEKRVKACSLLLRKHLQDPVNKDLEQLVEFVLGNELVEAQAIEKV